MGCKSTLVQFITALCNAQVGVIGRKQMPDQCGAFPTISDGGQVDSSKLAPIRLSLRLVVNICCGFLFVHIEK